MFCNLNYALYLRNYGYDGDHIFLYACNQESNQIFDIPNLLTRFFPLLKQFMGTIILRSAYCVLPDHIHLLLKLEENDRDFSSVSKKSKENHSVVKPDTRKNEIEMAKPFLGAYHQRRGRPERTF